MKKYYFYITLLLIVSFLFSCENWFDVQPKAQVKSDNLFETQDGFKRALIGVYSLMAGNQSYGDNGTMSFMEVLGGSYTSVKVNTNNLHEASKYNYDANKETVLGLWKHSYTSIANLNNLLENIDEKQHIFDDGIYEIIKGEALGLRAFIHFDLLRSFAPAPINGLDADAIPYVDAVSTVPFSQLTVEQVLARVITDLEAAEQLLKDYDPIGPAFETYEEERSGYIPPQNSIDVNNFLWFRKERMNYYAILGTLARVHLYRGTSEDMTKAYTYANKVISSNKILLNEAVDFNATPTPPSVMTFIAQEYVFSLYKRDLSELNEKYFHFAGPNKAELSVDGEKLNEYYEIDRYGSIADIRLNKLFATNSDGTSKYLVKYEFGTFNVNRVPLLKISEMYLIAAEASNNSQPLMHLRRMRGLKADDPGNNLRDEIALEYRKEFLGEGQMFYYYKRLNQLVSNAMTSTDQFVLPIPDTEEERGLIN